MSNTSTPDKPNQPEMSEVSPSLRKNEVNHPDIVGRALEEMLHRESVNSRNVTPISLFSDQQVPQDQQKPENGPDNWSQQPEDTSEERSDSSLNVKNEQHWNPIQFPDEPYELSGTKKLSTKIY
jgi:hypothetical protein